MGSADDDNVLPLVLVDLEHGLLVCLPLQELVSKEHLVLLFSHRREPVSVEGRW